MLLPSPSTCPECAGRVLVMPTSGARASAFNVARVPGGQWHPGYDGRMYRIPRVSTGTQLGYQPHTCRS